MLPARPLHSWNLTPREAIQLQHQLRPRIQKNLPPKQRIHTIAGADISWDPTTKMGFAGVIVYEYPGLREVDRTWANGRATFPYIPGLLSFREGPLLLAAFQRLKIKPDLIFIDGHGYAHPRRFGIACHMGLWQDIPTIGCGKSRLVGEFKDPTQRRGAHSSLRDKNEVIGSVLRTNPQTKPVFVSLGHRISLKQALRWTLACCDGYRIPKPTREADRFVAELRQQALASPTVGKNPLLTRPPVVKA
jgi:deoxyribonuclease V